MRLRSLAPFLVALLGFSSGSRVGHAQTGQVTFYVATNGNDGWSGRSPAPSPADGPFATLQRARDAVRDLKRQQGGSLRQPVTVAIRTGTYFLSETLLLVPLDSGTANAPITYTGYQDERPLISGGRQIAGWRQVNLEGKDLWAAVIPAALRADWYFRQLWVNGQRRTRARHPNQGLFRIAALPDATADWLQGQNRFQYALGDIRRWNNLTDVEVVLFSMWVSATCQSPASMKASGW